MATPSFDAYMDSFEARLAKYIPPRSDWTPADEALYGPRDLYRVPPAEAETLQLRAIQFTFARHYTHNTIYHKFCQEHGVSPDDIKTPEDLEKIPLISDRFFKQYPEGRDFAVWLGNIYTGELPRIVIHKEMPTFEEVVNAFNAAGLVVAYSSGTSGRHTVIPRDQRTFYASEYAAAKAATTMTYPDWEYNIHGYLLMPNPRKTNVFAGKVGLIYFDSIEDVQVAIDRDVSAETVRSAMAGQKGVKNAVVRFVSQRATHQMVDRIIRWIEQHRESTDRKIALLGAPFIVYFVLNRLREQGRSFDLSERGGILTGGCWKIYEDKRLSAAEFRREVKEVLGIREDRCLDVYGMVEGNGWMVQCPEGHYLHVPYSYYRPLVLDKEFKPLGYGEWGRFAFLDSAAWSYPGFIVTGDMVRLLERCPVCDRPGPVLEPEVRRAAGEDMRGCAEEVRRVLAADLGA